MTRSEELREIEAAMAAGRCHRISLAEAQAYDADPERQPRARGFVQFARGVSPLVPPAPSCRTPRG